MYVCIGSSEIHSKQRYISQHTMNDANSPGALLVSDFDCTAQHVLPVHSIVDLILDPQIMRRERTVTCQGSLFLTIRPIFVDY